MKSASKKIKKQGKDKEVVRLKDLLPRKEVKGGAGKIVFGASAGPFWEVEEEKKGTTAPPRQERTPE